MSIEAHTPIQYLKGVGPKLAALFNEKGIYTAEDLLRRFPRAYEDQRQIRTVSSLQEGELSVLGVELVQVQYRKLRNRRRILEWTCTDATGILKVLFFHIIPSVHLALKQGTRLRLVGKPEKRGNFFQLVHPQFRVLDSDFMEADPKACIVPIYGEAQPIHQSTWRKIVQNALPQVRLEESYIGRKVLHKLLYPTLEEAVMTLHNPSLDVDFSSLQAGQNPAYLRFVFEEFLLYELSLLLTHRRQTDIPSYLIGGESVLWESCQSQLPFELTSDQKKVIKQLVSQLHSGRRTYALIQGDVGSGKTLVALALCLHAIDSKLQAAMMAPTELLAEQHFRNIKNYLKTLSVNVGLITGSMPSKEKELTLKKLKLGEIQCVVGTHALIQESVEFQRLGIIIIDEQHRFGVEQRLKLSLKGQEPHQIHMTATPIPRTLAMTLFGDMDVYSIREKPKDRKPIRTKWVTQNRRDKVYNFLEQECQSGRQAYIVYALIEESETLDLKNATEEFEKLKTQFPHLKMALLHGRVSAEERDATMRSFIKGETQVLVSTTIIEVGVDVPNATLMIIENAERFGLSQLHQLRGRVGRGDQQSWCVLVSGYAISQEGELRLKTMEDSDDGFFISEKDLEMRGPGEFFGSKQSGIPQFRYGDLMKHQTLLIKAREVAQELISEKEIEKEVKLAFGSKMSYLEA